MADSAPSSLFRAIRRLTLLGGLVLLGYLLWLPDVAWLRTHNPATFSLRQRREVQARTAGRPRRQPHSRQIWKPLSEISPHLIHAVLVAEDDRFYQHGGFDLEQIEEAVRRDWRRRKFVYGGSTLTQQLARTLYLSPNKNLLRKAKEAVITLQLEHTLTKRRILELYLNVVEWGNGVYGAEAAAQSYFKKPAADLTPDEAIALASILPSPRRWSPSSERAFMARRRTQLFERMRQAGFVPPALSTAPAAPEETGLFEAEHLPAPSSL